MEFHVTEQMANRQTDQLETVGAALGVEPKFIAVHQYAPGSREDFAAYLSDHRVEFFSLEEIIIPHDAEKARAAGFEELVPPLHLWPWAMLVLRLGDDMRRRLGRPVRLRNLYRPMSYNERVATSGITSDHPNACAGDFDFRSRDDRRTAESLIRDWAARVPDLEISLGMGDQTLHVGVMSPKGTRYWFYKSYSDPEMRLGSPGSDAR
ncbi:MAG: hypothetical protein WA966_08475 [Ornithinimicrobium sp.]